MNPLFKTGYSRRLEVEDMYNVVPEDQSDVLGSRLENEWQKEVERSKTRGGKPSLLKCLIRIFGLEYMLLGIVLFLEESTKVCQPLLLGGLIRYFTPDTTLSRQDAFLYAMGVSLCAVNLAVLHHPYFFGVQRIGMKMRVACCSLLYRKSMRLSNHALGQTTTGQIVNLMSNDVNRFDQAVVFLHFLWIGPLEGIAVLAILWRELGPSTLAGFSVLLLLVPIQGWMGKLFSKFRQKTAVHTDERVRLMNEIISGMRVIKMYCWEKPFGELVEKIRSSEMKKLRATSYLRAYIIGLYVASGKLIIYLIFLIYTLVGGHLTPEDVFVAIAFVSAIHLSTTMFIPFAIQCATEARVTLKRIKVIMLQYKNSTEVAQVQKSSRLKAVSLMLTFAGRHICMLGILMVIAFVDQKFRATILFIVIVQFSNLRRSICHYTVRAVEICCELSVTLTRLQFLSRD
ncbi:hypothetical protein ACJMK2_018356 [Sinanodonta woodiana]|uniref:ABC transmembrane type-1 domain-containing protein n=1 Tax=Sinanodonta woodiana TaxID=1069815 RepID=A0ABD3UGG1_SINWO